MREGREAFLAGGGKEGRNGMLRVVLNRGRVESLRGRSNVLFRGQNSRGFYEREGSEKVSMGG